ncbi:Hypothetical predicted protein [Prunus dulcis]|uniref:Uncharacterized protein n=1 Tax=Prunus dulcis TaxID=3755 RepID=A0A5E4GP40_PRUDU|nr:Hypothetical predicted protein [Prunus dulcis]
MEASEVIARRRAAVSALIEPANGTYTCTRIKTSLELQCPGIKTTSSSRSSCLQLHGREGRNHNGLRREAAAASAPPWWPTSSSLISAASNQILHPFLRVSAEAEALGAQTHLRSRWLRQSQPSQGGSCPLPPAASIDDEERERERNIAHARKTIENAAAEGAQLVLFSAS